MTTHAWIQRGTLIVDITADQFEEINESVLVLYDSEWHEQWSGEVKSVADYRVWDSSVDLESIYFAITAQAEAL